MKWKLGYYRGLKSLTIAKQVLKAKDKQVDAIKAEMTSDGAGRAQRQSSRSSVAFK